MKKERGSQFVRQWKIMKRLEMLHYGSTAEDMSEELGYSKRTIYRDLEILQSVGLPLEKERAGKNIKWRLAKGYKTPQIPFTLTELMALYFSKGLFEPLKGTPFKSGIDSALDKIRRTLPVNAIDFIISTEQTIIPKIGPFKDYKDYVQIIEQLNYAMREKKKCNITYLAYGREKSDKHLYHPYALTYYYGILYCVGFSELRQAIRIFAIQRVQMVEVLEETFKIPEDETGEEFEVARFLDESFGISHEGKLENVVLRFSKEIAPWIMERNWHPTQEITKLPNGEIEMKMKVTGMSDLFCWLLPMGDDVKVIQPKQLMEDIVKTCEQTVKQYKKQ